MRDDARARAAIEILDNFLTGSHLNQTLAKWNKDNKFAGSSDREKIRDVVFDILRLRNTLKYPIKLEKIRESGRSLMLSYVLYKNLNIENFFTGSKYGPNVLDTHERNILEKFFLIKDDFFKKKYDVPDFLVNDLKLSLCKNFERIMSGLGERAPIFVRVNIMKTDLSNVIEELKGEGISSEICSNSKQGLRILNNFRRIKMSKMFQEGLLEFQDLNSQKVIEECDFSEQSKILDFCAGAGGKILCLASLLKGKGNFYAFDIDRKKLKSLEDRAKKAGITVNLLDEKEIKELNGSFDCIILDVPCSGSGAWRRNPQQKWRITQENIDNLNDLQLELLKTAKSLLKRKGKLIYITCSLLKSENEIIVERFLVENPTFSFFRQKHYYPGGSGDGFYCAELKKN